MIREKEARFLKFIQEQAKREVNKSDLEFLSWQNYVEIENINLYHDLAQGLNPQKLLYSNQDGLFYCIKVPRYSGDETGDPWNINLIKQKEENFLKKYQEQYQIKTLDSNPK